MSKPRGIYTDPVFDWAHNLRPVEDWFWLTVMTAGFAAIIGWAFVLLPALLVAQLLGIDTRSWMSDGNVGLVYGLCVATWVVPVSTLSAVTNLLNRGAGEDM